MRKNRANNGYIGIRKHSPFIDGCMSTSAMYNGEIGYSQDAYKDFIPILDIPSDGGGSGGQIYLGLSGSISGIHMPFGGCGGYTTTPIVKIFGNGLTLFAVGSRTSGNTMSGLCLTSYVKTVVVTNGGKAYSSTPTVTFSLPPSPYQSASASCDINGWTLTVNTMSSGQVLAGMRVSGTGVTFQTRIEDYGTGTGGLGTYTLNLNHATVPNRSMTFDGTATGTAITAGNEVIGISMTYRGAGYPTPPIVTFSGGTTLGATQGFRTAVAVVELEYGSGFTTAPKVQIFGGGLTANGLTAFASVKYDVSSIGISSGGQYSSTPTIQISGVFGYTAATATLSGGTISSVSYDSEVIKFSQPPQITIGGLPQLPTVVEGESKIVASMAVYPNNTSFVSFRVHGITYKVDWGDGTTALFAGGATATKNYSLLSFNGLTGGVIDQSYKVAVIQVTPATGTTGFRGFEFVRDTTTTGLTSGIQACYNVLAIKMAGETLSGITIHNGFNTNWRLYNLKTFEFVGQPGNFTNATYMFYNCYNLQQFIGENMFIRCTSTPFAFQGCANLRYCSKLNTPLVTTMGGMFNGCSSLNEAPEMITDNVTTFGNMFTNCTSLQYVPHYNTKNVTSFQSTFIGCTSLKTVPAFDTRAVTNFADAFNNCRTLRYAPALDTSQATTISQMFFQCYSLIEIPEYDFGNCTVSTNAFQSCYSLAEVKALNLARCNNMSSMFNNCPSLRYVPPIDCRAAVILDSMFAGCASLTEAPKLLNTNSIISVNALFQTCSGLRKVHWFNTSNVTNFGSMFQNCIALEEIPNFDFSAAIRVDSLFSGCTTLRRIPFMNMPCVQNVSGLFNNCSSLEEIDGIYLFEGKNFPGRTSFTFTNTFNSCFSLAEIPDFDMYGSTGNASALSSTFNAAYSLQRIKARNMTQSFSISTSPLIGITALNEIYTNLATVGASGSGSRTITVTSVLGASGDNTGIATAKGWAVSG